MGLNLHRESLNDWLSEYGPRDRRLFLKRLEEHVGSTIDPDAWRIVDDEYPRVGSYTTYGIFIDCLWFVTEGADYADEFTADDDVERAAFDEFVKNLSPASCKIPYAEHFLDSGDTDTLFIPVLFERPMEFEETFVASLPGAVIALEHFASELGFDLNQAREPEAAEGRWLPVTIAKNVARTLYAFFKKSENACVAYS